MKKETIKFYYSSNFVTVKKNPDVNNTEFVAMLVWFLGASALPFCDFFFCCLRWAGDACSTQVKPRGSEVPRYLVSGEKCAVLGFTVTHACCTGPAKQNGSAPIPGSRIGVATSSVLLTISDSISKVHVFMCNYKIFFWKLFRYTFSISTKSLHYRKKSIWRYFFNDNTGNIGRLKYRLKNDIPKYRRSLIYFQASNATTVQN